jgi:hypothetical protein
VSRIEAASDGAAIRALQQHASCIATAIEAAYGAEATTTLRAALDAENPRLHGRIVGVLQLSAVV